MAQELKFSARKPYLVSEPHNSVKLFFLFFFIPNSKTKFVYNIVRRQILLSIPNLWKIFKHSHPQLNDAFRSLE